MPKLANSEEYEFKKILEHPDKDEIITKLTMGESTRELAKWLKFKYPKQKKYTLTHNTLDKFRRNHLRIYGDILTNIKAKTKAQIEKETIRATKTYAEKIQEAVQTQVDWKEKLLKLMNVVETRFAQLYDFSQSNVNDYQPDKTMLEWMNKILQIIQEIRKIEGAPDQVIQHNVTVQTIDQHANILQQAIINTLEELDWEQSSILIDKLNRNIEALKPSELITPVIAPTIQSNKTKADLERLDKLTSNLLPK